MVSMFPIPQRYYVPDRIRQSYKPRLEAAGLWNLQLAEKEPKKPFREIPKVDQLEENIQIFQEAFGREKVWFVLGVLYSFVKWLIGFEQNSDIVWYLYSVVGREGIPPSKPVLLCLDVPASILADCSLKFLDQLHWTYSLLHMWCCCWNLHIRILFYIHSSLLLTPHSPHMLAVSMDTFLGRQSHLYMLLLRKPRHGVCWFPGRRSVGKQKRWRKRRLQKRSTTPGCGGGS